ncbi:MAG: VanZ family protein [Candidatus Competibacteraceae bacterium]|nr:VanZ family protein [Candidatus Competibacteraceae bacterium]
MLLFPWLPPLLARMALTVAAITIAVLALMPAPAVPVSTSWDKLDHWFAFFTLALLAEQAFPQQPFWRRIAPGVLIYGAGIEVAQSFTSDRDASAMDVLADGIGIAAYGVVRQLAAMLVRPARIE